MLGRAAVAGVWRRLKASLFTATPVLDAFLSHVARVRRMTLRHTTFVGITGSCGKTTCTELTHAILTKAGNSVIGDRNNRERATARAVLALSSDVKFCVRELSGEAPGKIAEHVFALRPDIGIVTMVGGDHYKAFRTLDETAKEKGRLVEGLPSNGTAILNADDPLVLAMASRTRARILTFGVSPDADVRAYDVSSGWPDRLTFTAAFAGQSTRVETRLPGSHWLSSVLPALAAGLACGLELATCARAVAEVEPVFGRYSVHPVPNGPVFVLDSTKAPLWTMASSFAFLEMARATRKTLILGTLSDYAGRGSQRYRKVARQALAIADRVIFVGRQAGHVDKLRAEAGDRLSIFSTAYQADRFVAQQSKENELILVKASPTDHLERIALSHFDDVVCWREGCGKQRPCPRCGQYRVPSPPPLAQAVAAAEEGLPRDVPQQTEAV